MSSWIKKALIVLVIAFALFYLFTRPEDAAAAVRGFFNGFSAVGRFFTELANGW